jgi:hypothetical protein
VVSTRGGFFDTPFNQQIEDDTTWATARLPGLQIEIVHRQPATAEYASGEAQRGAQKPDDRATP